MNAATLWGSIGNNTVAFNTGDTNLACGDQVLIVGLAGSPGTVKTLTGACPKCTSVQLDNYTTAAAFAVGSLQDFGNFQTIRINR